jgi:hypothetical protein
VPALFTRTVSTRVDQISAGIRARRAGAIAAGGRENAGVRLPCRSAQEKHPATPLLEPIRTGKGPQWVDRDRIE